MVIYINFTSAQTYAPKCVTRSLPNDKIPFTGITEYLSKIINHRTPDPNNWISDSAIGCFSVQFLQIRQSILLDTGTFFYSTVCQYINYYNKSRNSNTLINPFMLVTIYLQRVIVLFCSEFFDLELLYLTQIIKIGLRKCDIMSGVHYCIEHVGS